MTVDPTATTAATAGVTPGPAIDTLPLRIYSSLEFSPDPGVAAASTVLILIAAFVVIASERLLAGRHVVG